MSKVNAMQAMREARYAARAPITAPTVPARPPRVGEAAPVAGKARGAVDAGVAKAVDPAEPEPAAEAPEEALCGHRSMNNRICKRPTGHPEKNHRYN